jgi:hypothetical protein
VRKTTEISIRIATARPRFESSTSQIQIIALRLDQERRMGIDEDLDDPGEIFEAGTDVKGARGSVVG